MTAYHVFALPPDFLHSLIPRNFLAADNQQAIEPSSSDTVPPPSTSATLACNICLGISFSAINEQRMHFRSDWHRYNVKNRINGGQPVSESDFNQLIDALEDSLSGSESSSDEETGSDSERDAVSTLVNKQKLPARSDSPETSQRRVPRTAISWFHSPPSTQIGVYRALFPYDTPEDGQLQALKDMQEPVPHGRSWAMFMVAGGHFAGAIVRVSRAAEVEVNAKKSKKPVPETEVLRHKTFHRYTTRRKQGGSQSLNDNAKGNAKSAGALLRRYGEQALRDDIRNLLTDWEEEINDCELIFIRASGANRKIFMDYDGAPILKGDERLRTFPFPTRRPTQSELSRCLQELTRIKVSHFTEEALRAQDEAYLASLPKPKPITTVPAPVAVEKPNIKPIKMSKEEEMLREKWSRLVEMVSKGRLEPLKTFWEREGKDLGGIDARIPEWIGEKRVATLLQLAAHSNQEDVVNWLLEMRADPTIPVPRVEIKGYRTEEGEEHGSNPRHNTAYDLAQSRSVRDVFRRNAGANPEWWDWFGAAHVPSALSKEMEDERDEKKKARRKGLKDRVKEREIKEKEKEKEKPTAFDDFIPSSAPVTGPRKLGGGGDIAGVTGLTPEMRLKIERERRARAVEARLKQGFP
ncbi:hypothetical protein EV361DRAFT_844420 [Lentinula raphanica]|uniref:VLRF1 domain-containing protein n=1 Tax=Lentinula raphanica TaxID=153919 RepID=A0AA38NZX7_9AGAR|nr:hypothetical protein F5880DRAFT_1720854 [Lentinula raphanica]KAJ3833620.1 hypothetical protein F5878DRAFT_569526 [Lentinula raphanica]KAJ3972907.1 hypothetical protein EV361DRAFT_844420 [Lentinula raphanica]